MAKLKKGFCDFCLKNTEHKKAKNFFNFFILICLNCGFEKPYISKQKTAIQNLSNIALNLPLN